MARRAIKFAFSTRMKWNERRERERDLKDLKSRETNSGSPINSSRTINRIIMNHKRNEGTGLLIAIVSAGIPRTANCREVTRITIKCNFAILLPIFPPSFPSFFLYFLFNSSIDGEWKERKKEKEKRKRFNVLYISATHSWNILTIIVRRLSKNNKNRSKRVDFTVWIRNFCQSPR